MQPCTMAKHFLWPLDLASLLQVQPWQRSCYIRPLLCRSLRCHCEGAIQGHVWSGHCFVCHSRWVCNWCSVWRLFEPCSLLRHLLCTDHQWRTVLQLPCVQPVRVRWCRLGCWYLPRHSPI